MNVPLPFMKHPYAFWGIALVMLAITVGLLLFFRRRKWV
jgi:LPXTG-motif cell wall-anchored protein